MQQLSVFDFMEKEKPNVPVLQEGDTLYKVVKADVFLLQVLRESWIIWRDNMPVQYWRLKYPDGCYDICNQKQLGESFFMTKADAEEEAKQYTEENEVILAENMELKDFHAFTYVSESNNRNMYAYIGKMSNGMLYVKDFFTYTHAVKDTKKNRQAFAQSIEKYNATPVDYVPELKNLYPCIQEGVWQYAEANYMY